MNTWSTKKVVDANRVVTIKAEKTDANQSAQDIDRLLQELGNEGKALPFYAVYPADGREPIILQGPISKRQIREALLWAGPSKDVIPEVTALIELDGVDR